MLWAFGRAIASDLKRKAMVVERFEDASDNKLIGQGCFRMLVEIVALVEGGEDDVALSGRPKDDSCVRFEDEQLDGEVAMFNRLDREACAVVSGDQPKPIVFRGRWSLKTSDHDELFLL